MDALRGSRAFLASDCHAGCRFVSGLFARPMTAGLDGLSASHGSHLDSPGSSDTREGKSPLNSGNPISAGKDNVLRR